MPVMIPSALYSSTERTTHIRRGDDIITIIALQPLPALSGNARAVAQGEERVELERRAERDLTLRRAQHRRQLPALARVHKQEHGVVLIDELGTWPEGSAPPLVIISTVPASATTTDPGTEHALFLPSSIFATHLQGVVVDMAYKPAETPLLQLAKAVGGEHWSTVPGVEVLLEQGFVQFELWTGRACPRKSVSKTVWAKYLGQA